VSNNRRTIETMTIRREGYARFAVANRLIGAIVGRRSKWIFVLAGVVLTLALAPLASKLAPLEDNSPASFLPGNAASTQVLKYEQAHGRTAAQPALVVYERRTGLTATDRRTIARARSELAARRPIGAGAPTPVLFSPTGRAAFFSIPISGTVSTTVLGDDVSQIRAVVARGATPATAEGSGDALRVAVGGPAGSAADAVQAFAGIDTKLLGVTVVIVALLLLLIYRSPILWLVPLASVGLAAAWSQGVAYLLARSGFVINGMTVGILTVLVFGAGTDYSLLLVARYREELRRQADTHVAMAVALRRAGPAILTSGVTVVLGLLCLLLAQLNDVAALGPACAGAIVCALVAQLVVLPALLLVLGRRAFWPFIPRVGDEVPEEAGLFGKLGRLLSRRRRPVWIGILLLMGGCCFGLLAYQGGLTQQNGFVGKVDSVEAQNLLGANFPGIAAPKATVLVLDPSAAARARATALDTPGIAAASQATPIGKAVAFDVTLSSDRQSAASSTVVRLRQHLTEAVGARTLVGGQIATDVDIADAASHDRAVIIPVVAAVVLVMLGLILRSVVAPFMLVATVLLSFFASLGITAVVVRYLFNFTGFDPSVPIFGFVFLVALGVDYNIFLMTRVREEASFGHAVGVMKGLAVTGSVITSAGVVLAATFSVLAVLPLAALVEVGFLVAFGVLVDTTLVRSALVPALALEIGPRLWWPSSLWRRSRGRVGDMSDGAA
jgi:RND superfamily putative drug exporter